MNDKYKINYLNNTKTNNNHNNINNNNNNNNNREYVQLFDNKSYIHISN